MTVREHREGIRRASLESRAAPCNAGMKGKADCTVRSTFSNNCIGLATSDRLGWHALRILEFIGRLLGSAAVAWTLAATMSAAESMAAQDAPASTPGPTPSDAVPVAWQHHRVQFSYVGQTTLYSCTGLEAKVRDILLFLGVRNDLTVRAQGCPEISAPSHMAWVRVEFDTLAPLDGNPAGITPVAHWVPFSITARRPRFMDEGDCELIQAMKDAIGKEFGLQHLDYRVRCFPHALSSDDFAITGNALRMQSGAMTQARLKPLGN